ncbi:MAG: tRNA (N6-isopentenyl adenosine(37)-C2)-methylthiotransferase MiaB, partial [Phycisphaerae bacterium]|nr:tRNA (N6-isopentenyl adenosine(37)-C2)-methylthiotransferase MiaB [Phycisphaerae bacterium]
GCQMNKLDSELVAGELLGDGFELAEQADAADVVVFNTCSVRQHAENRVLTCLGRLAEQKAQRPGLVAALVGCMAQRQGLELLEQFPALDIVCGPGELHRLGGLIKKVRAGASQQLAVTERLRARRDVPAGLEELDVSRRAAKGFCKAQAYVRVMRGCDKFCSYCIVPSVRGREISRPPRHILDEACRLVEAGCIEITLLGQTVNSYCYGGDGREIRFAELLRKVGAIAGLERLRFVTSYPIDFSEDIFRAMAEVPAVCNYLHLPAQSGSDRILAAMNRPYTAGEYLALIERGRAIVGDLSLAGDFIVGFPGESEQDFEETVRLVRAVGYKNCFIFKYSPRPGTAAAKRLKDDVPAEVKRQRNNELLAVQEEVSLELHRAFIGQTVEVLVEGPSKSARKGRAEHQYQLTGRTRGDHIVVFDAPGRAEQLTGKFAEIKILEASALTLFGELASLA